MGKDYRRHRRCLARVSLSDHVNAYWENMQRIFLSLALKTTTQSIVVGKLSAYARKNKTRRALWEYDHIIRSLCLPRLWPF
jgi:TnpA family transposase